MSVVRKVFQIPLLESRIIMAQDVDNIFLNWQEILDCNKAFLRELQQRADIGSDIIGDVICFHVSYYCIHVSYCNKRKHFNLSYILPTSLIV